MYIFYLRISNIFSSTFGALTIKLVLDDVVKDLQQEEDQVVVLCRGEEEPGGGEGL